MGDGELRIRGSVIKDPRDWMKTAYGEDSYQAALDKLSAHEREVIDGQILAGGWYPIEAWDRFHAAMRDEARRRGHTEQQFNMRNMREAGSSTARTIYKFVLGLMNARSVMEKAVVIFNRAYSEGRAAVVTNDPGRAVVRYCECSPKLRTNLANNFGQAFVVLLELNGCKNVSMQCTRDEIVDGKLVFEVTLTYR